MSTRDLQLKGSLGPTYCGYVAIIGRPNVGKSTLLNAFLEKKLSITSRKPQTTRHRILGIKTVDNLQYIFIDTPGMHSPKGHFKLLNQQLNRTAFSALREADIIMWVIEANAFLPEDEIILDKLMKNKNSKPFLIVINKLDSLKNQNTVLPFIHQLSEKLTFLKPEFIPISAKKGTNIKTLEMVIKKFLPENPFFFDQKTLTDRDSAFVSAEIIREKLVRFLGQELPYAVVVSIEKILYKKTSQKKPIIHISAVIWVEKNGQKKIVIGSKGEKLKQIGEQARISLEKYFDQKIFLKLWVKVKVGWSENKLFLQQIMQ